MTEKKIKDIIYSPITGEWGNEDISGDGVFIIRTTNFNKTGKINYVNLTKRYVDKNTVNRKKLQIGDVIIEKSGGGPNTPVGRVVIFELESNDVFLCNNFTTILRPIKGIVIPKFLLYQLSYFYKIRKVEKYQTQTIGLYNLKLDRYLNEKINLPSKDEQFKIVTLLDKIQTLIQKRNTTIQLLENYLPSLFIEMFGDPIIDNKEIGLKRLSFFGIWRSGGTPAKNEQGYYSGNIPWFTSGELNDIFVEKSKNNISVNAIDETSAKKIESNSLLIGMYDTAALKCSINLVESSCNQAIAFSKLKEDICNPIFIYFNLIIARDYYLNKRKGARQKNLNLTTIKNLKVLYAEKALQDEFAEKALHAYSIKHKCHESLQLLETLYQVFLQSAFDNENMIDEKKIFEDILKELTQEDIKKGKRIEYLVDWLSKNKQIEFSNFDNYNAAIKLAIDLLDDGSIEQYIANNKVELKKAL